jgi:hypothetical protein
MPILCKSKGNVWFKRKKPGGETFFLKTFKKVKGYFIFADAPKVGALIVP